MDLSPVDLGENARRDIVLTMEDMGYDVASSHHEIAPAQHEIDFTMSDVLETADKFMIHDIQSGGAHGGKAPRASRHIYAEAEGGCERIRYAYQYGSL